MPLTERHLVQSPWIAVREQPRLVYESATHDPLFLALGIVQQRRKEYPC